MLVAFLLNSCKKDLSQDSPVNNTASEQEIKVPENFFKEGLIPGVTNTSLSNELFTSTSNATSTNDPLPNNGDDPIVLGSQLTNPYSIPNMQQAYNTLYGSGTAIIANNLYVRFKPTSSAQLETLEDNTQAELQDYPMDYEVTQDGDYYQDPTVSTETIPWLYSSVPTGFVAPAGIQYEVIVPLYIPATDTLLETMAESLAAGAAYKVSTVNGNRVITRTDQTAESLVIPIANRPYCSEGYHLIRDDNGIYMCVPNNCPEGYHWNGTSCIPDCPSGYYWNGTNCVQIVQTPPPPDPNYPRGNIGVQTDNGCNVANANAPLRQARVVCKRWFKIWRGYTNDQGLFVCDKKFKNKVKVIVKTKNEHARVAKVRGVRLWQMLFPVKKRLGVFGKGEMANIVFVFAKPADGSAHNKDLPYWVAATTHNSLLEFRDYATEFGVGLPPERLKILISNWGGGFSATGIAPMFNKCPGDFTAGQSEFFIAKASILTLFGLPTTLVITVLKNQVDVIINYQAPNADYVCRLNTVWINQLAYHEFGHAAHYNQAGSGFWLQYRNAIANELTKLNQTEFHPYGTGNDQNNAPILATGEMWGNHCEYIFANRKYGVMNGITTRMQSAEFSNPTNSGLSCFFDAIENFNPNNTGEKWSWIPQGLPYDLNDNRNEQILGGFPNINDAVNSYTNQQIFNALQSDVRSIPAFRNRLLLQNNNNQAANVNLLFNQYGY